MAGTALANPAGDLPPRRVLAALGLSRLAAVYDQRWDRLTDLNQAILELLLEGFGIQIRLLRSSDLRPRGRKTQMLIDLCHLTDSRALRVGAGALDYLDFAALAKAGIGVQVATYSHPPYPRGRQPFIPGLSALDLLLHHGAAGHRILSQGSQLTTWTGAIPA